MVSGWAKAARLTAAATSRRREAVSKAAAAPTDLALTGLRAGPDGGMAIISAGGRQYLLRPGRSLPGGLSQALDLPEANAARDQFYAKGAGKSASQVKATWARLTFSGKATPPKELGSAADVKKFVAANPDAIGYIEKSAVDGTVKAILTID